jgi:hypothetical protein
MTSPNIQAAVDNLVAAIRAELRDEFLTLIGDSDAPAKARARRSTKAGRKPPARRRPKGAKRSPEEIEQLTKSVLGYIRKSPGQRVEQIAGGLGTTTKELTLPISKLLAAKVLKTRGVRRGTTYTAK